MLGFNAISEVSIAELPGAFAPVDGLSSTSSVGAAGVITFGAANVTGQALTLALDDGFSVTGTASISLTGFSATLSLADVLVWGRVVPGVTTTFSNVNTSNSPTWTTVTTGASQTWTEEKR
tara:strand:- start:1728 stop:2090 length:363 start_codon:yes stop_codon:yes gene_type:complete